MSILIKMNISFMGTAIYQEIIVVSGSYMFKFTGTVSLGSDISGLNLLKKANGC